MRIGTNHFQSFTTAYRYYMQYEPNAYQSTLEEREEWIHQKISAQEIVIGPPTLKPGETMYVNDEGRYVIETEEK